MEKFKNYIKSKKKMLFSIIFLLICFILMAVLVFTGKFTYIDTYIHSYILKIRGDNLTSFFNLVTEFGGATFLLAISVLSVLILKSKKISILLLINLFSAFLLNETVKSIFMRERPTGINLISETGYSFPSGHSMVSLAFYGLIIYLILKNNSNKTIKIITPIIGLVLVILIGFSRIYLGVHYFSDVITGFLLGTIYLILFINFIKEKM